MPTNTLHTCKPMEQVLMAPPSSGTVAKVEEFSEQRWSRNPVIHKLGAALGLSDAGARQLISLAGDLANRALQPTAFTAAPCLLTVDSPRSGR